MSIVLVIIWGFFLLIVAVLAAYCGGFIFELLTGCDRATKRHITNQAAIAGLLTGIIGGISGFLWGAYVVDNIENLGITAGSAIAIAVQRWMVWGALMGVVYAIVRPILTRQTPRSPSTPTPKGQHHKTLISGAIVLALLLVPPLLLRPVFAQLPPTSSLNMGGQLLLWGIGATALWAYAIVPLLWRWVAPRNLVQPAREWGMIAGLLLGGWITAGGYAIAVLNTEPITVASSTRPGAVVYAIVQPILLWATFLSTASVMSWRIYRTDPAQIQTNIRQKIHHLQTSCQNQSKNPLLFWTGLWSVAAFLTYQGSSLRPENLWMMVMGQAWVEAGLRLLLYIGMVGVGFGLLTTTLAHGQQGFGVWFTRVWGQLGLGLLLALIWGGLWWWTVRFPTPPIALLRPIAAAIIQGFASALLWQHLQPTHPQPSARIRAGAIRGAVYAAALNIVPFLLILWDIFDRLTGGGLFSLANIVVRSVVVTVIVAIAWMVIQQQLTRRAWLTIIGFFILAMGLQFILAQVLNLVRMGIGQGSLSLPRLWGQVASVIPRLAIQGLQGAVLGGIVGAIAAQVPRLNLPAASPAPQPDPSPSTSTPLDQARAGKPHAIAALLNNALQSQQITARVTRKAQALQILLEGDRSVPPQETTIAFLTRGLMKLRSPHLHHIQVAARQNGDQGFTWKTQFTLPKKEGD